MWAENRYNTNIIHSNLAFPLLAKLVQKGDQVAKRVFKKEVVKKLSSGFLPTILKLIYMGYTYDLDLYDYETSFEEMRKVMNQEDLQLVIREESEISSGGGYLGNYEKLALKYSLNHKELKIIKEIEFHIGRFIPHFDNDSIKGPLMHIENNTIKSLALDGINLSHVPEIISELDNVVKLGLSNNNLKKVPSEIGGMNSLKILSVNNNLLERLPRSISKLENLETLILSGNKFSKIPLSIFSSLENLRVLLMTKNNISYIPKEIMQLKGLKRLYLGENNIKVIPKEIAQLQELEALDLNSNKIKSIPKEIALLRKLESLDLRNNLVKNIPKCISQLSSLKKLRIRNNPLEIETH